MLGKPRRMAILPAVRQSRAGSTHDGSNRAGLSGIELHRQFQRHRFCCNQHICGPPRAALSVAAGKRAVRLQARAVGREIACVSALQAGHARERNRYRPCPGCATTHIDIVLAVGCPATVILGLRVIASRFNNGALPLTGKTGYDRCRRAEHLSRDLPRRRRAIKGVRHGANIVASEIQRHGAHFC